MAHGKYEPGRQQPHRRGVFTASVAAQEQLCSEHHELVLDVPGFPTSE